MFVPLVGTMMDGEHAFATSGGTAWRRRQRRIRAFRRLVLWHSKMEVAAALHHKSRQRSTSTAVATQTMNYAPDPAYSATTMTTSALIEYVAPAPVIADFLELPMPVIEHVMPAPVVNHTAPSATTPAPTDTPVIEHVELAPVIGYIALGPPLTFSTPSQQFHGCCLNWCQP